MTLPNTEQLRTSLESITNCDSLAGPVLQMVGVVFAVQAAQAQAQKEITRFVKDIERTRQKFNDDDFREKFSDEIQNLNAFDEAFKKAMETDLSSLVSDPFNSSMLSPDTFSIQNIGGYGMFPASGLEGNNISKFTPLGMTENSPSGNCSTKGVGSLGSVQFPELSRTSSQFRKASASLAGIGMSLANDPTRALDLATTVSSSLVKSFLVRQTILEDVRTSIGTIESLLLKLKDDDYELGFDEVIADAKSHVDQSLILLESIIDDLTASGAFKQSEKEELKDELQRAADELEVPTNFPRSSGFLIFMSVQGILITMDQQLRLLKALDTKILVALPNLSTYSTSLTDNFSLSNHYGGMFSVIQCGLDDISRQMTRAQRSGDVISMITLIPKWRIMILMHRRMVDVAAQDPTPPIAAELNTDYGGALAEVEQAASDALDVINQDSLDAVIEKVRSFMSLVQIRLKSDIGNEAIESRAQIARNAITQAISEQSSIQDALDQFIGDSPEQQARAEAFMAVIESVPYLYATTDALVAGDWEQFFSSDSLDSSAQNLLGKYLEAAARCVEDNNAPAAAAVRREAVRQVQESRLESVSRDYVYDVASRMQSSGITEILLLKSRLKRIQTLLQLPVFGGSFPARDVFAP